MNADVVLSSIVQRARVATWRCARALAAVDHRLTGRPQWLAVRGPSPPPTAITAQGALTPVAPRPVSAAPAGARRLVPRHDDEIPNGWSPPGAGKDRRYRLDCSRKGILAYLAIAFGGAWGLWAPPLLASDVSPRSPLFQLLVLPGACAPALAAAVVRRWVTREGFADAGMRPNLRRARRDDREVPPQAEVRLAQPQAGGQGGDGGDPGERPEEPEQVGAPAAAQIGP